MAAFVVGPVARVDTERAERAEKAKGVGAAEVEQERTAAVV